MAKPLRRFVAIGCKNAEIRMGLVGHCVHHPELKTVSKILWELTKGTRMRGWASHLIVMGMSGEE